VSGVVTASIAAAFLARRRFRLVTQIATGALSGVTAELFFKQLFHRERPTLLDHLEAVKSTSFPSGHATAAASLYMTLAFVSTHTPRWRARRNAMLAGGATLACAVGLTRVYLGVHWPSDVAAGLAMGAGWAYALERALWPSNGVRRGAARRHRTA
jgi:undecaprenyl-diphosphatase